MHLHYSYLTEINLALLRFWLFSCGYFAIMSRFGLEGEQQNVLVVVVAKIRHNAARCVAILSLVQSVHTKTIERSGGDDSQVHSGKAASAEGWLSNQ